MITNKETLLANLQKPIHFSIVENLQLAWKEFKSDVINYIIITLIGLLIPFIISSFGIYFSNFKILFGLIAMFLLTPTLLGTSICFHFKKIEGHLNIKKYFLAFKKIVPLFICQLLIIACVLAITLPLTVVDAIVNPDRLQAVDVFANMGLVMTITLILTTLLLIYTTINFTFTFYFCFFYELSAWQSLTMSIKYVQKNWIQFFSLYLIYALMMLIGFLLFKINLFLGIPILLIALPLIRLASYHVFAKFTGYEKEEIFTL